MENTSQAQETGFNPWKAFVRLQNPFMKWMLKSPFHFFVSKWYMLIRVTGRKSGRIYTIPIQYKQVGSQLHLISNRQYRWWRNLQGGAEVSLLLCGKSIHGKADVSENRDDVEAAFKAIYPGLKDASREKLMQDCVSIIIDL